MKLFKRLEDIFAATAFAEEGEYDTARVIATGDGSNMKSGAACHGNDCLAQPDYKVA